jgi:hypothetical protein
MPEHVPSCDGKINQDSSPVAQSVEQVTVNHWVGGSNPSGGAKNREAYNGKPFLQGELAQIRKINDLAACE